MIRNEDIIEKFLNRTTSSESTHASYKSTLKYFFKVIGANPDIYFNKEKFEDYEDDIWKFADAIKNRAEKSQKTILSIVKKFFSRNRVDIPSFVWDDIKTRNKINGAKSIIKYKTPTTEDLKKILSHCEKIQWKALFHFIATTGTRIGETLKLTIDDIDWDSRQVNLKRDITKGHYDRITFFTEETEHLLKEWLKVRHDYFGTAYNKSLYLRNKLEKQGYEIRHENDRWQVYQNGERISNKDLAEIDNRIFPFSEESAELAWRKILERAGEPYNKKDMNGKLKHKKYLYNIHGLRRFWFTSWESTKALSKHIDFMGAHISELSGTYKKIPTEKLKETYDKYSNCLAIFSELDKVIPKIENQDTAIASLVRQNHHLTNELKSLKSKMDDMIHNREQELEKAERTEITNKEYTKQLAKEHPDDYAKLVENVKLLNKKLGITTVS